MCKGGLKKAHQQAVVSQDQALSFGAQRGSQALALFFAKDNATKLRVDGLRIAIKVRHILIDHLQRSRKRTPGFARGAVAMTSRSHVGPCFVDCRVYKEACRVCRSAGISAHDDAVIVDQDHVGCLQGREVLAERIRPEGVWMLRVSDAYVSGHALGEAFPRKDAWIPRSVTSIAERGRYPTESACHVRQHPCPVLVVVGEERDAGQTDAL
jgi:hypothetical protein